MTDPNITYVRSVVEAAERVDDTFREWLFAQGDRDRLWKSDPSGRRERGLRLSRATRSRSAAYDRLLRLVWPSMTCAMRQRADAAVVERVLEIWRRNGPTPLEGAQGTGTINTRNFLRELEGRRVGTEAAVAASASLPPWQHSHDPHRIS